MRAKISEQEAITLQEELAGDVIRTGELKTLKLIAGTDVAYSKDKGKLIAAIVVLDANTLERVEQVIIEDEERFPYIPGLFSFREMPSLVKAFNQLKNKPDLVVIDGHGIAHPRRLGLASHFGVQFDIPTIGCGKTRFIGEYSPVGNKRGHFSDLIDNGEVIGNVLRTQDGIKPVFVSIGHKVSLSFARETVLKLCSKYRLPETTRHADALANKILKGY